MKWFSSTMLGVLAARNLGFGWALAEICQTFDFGKQQCHRGMSRPKSATQSLLDIATSLIGLGPIQRKRNGSAVPCLVCWLQKTLVLAGLWLKSAKPLASSNANEACHVQNQPHRASLTLYHHSLNLCGGNEMVQQYHAWCAGCKKPWFWLGSG
jgi:hypothetical protein